MKYRGSCHCGRIAFEAEGEIGDVVACNCSICQRRGSLLWFVPPDRMHLLTEPDAVGTYTFRTHAIKHRFCPECGMHPFGETVTPTGEQVFAVNVRCLEGIELETLRVQHFDGRSL